MVERKNKTLILQKTNNLKRKITLGLSYTTCIVSYIVALYVCVINIQEISERAQGHYTFYSQRAWLTDGEAVLYFTFWTIAFIWLGTLSVKNILKNRINKATIYGGILLAVIVASTFIDTLFYDKLP